MRARLGSLPGAPAFPAAPGLGEGSPESSLGCQRGDSQLSAPRWRGRRRVEGSEVAGGRAGDSTGCSSQPISLAPLPALDRLSFRLTKRKPRQSGPRPHRRSPCSQPGLSRPRPPSTGHSGPWRGGGSFNPGIASEQAGLRPGPSPTPCAGQSLPMAPEGQLGAQLARRTRAFSGRGLPGVPPVSAAALMPCAPRAPRPHGRIPPGGA